MADINEIISLGIGSPASIKFFTTFGLSLGAATTVPNVVGETKAQAITDITAVGLTESDSTAYSATVAAGLVISQNPAAGSQVAPGSNVSIVLSLGVQTDTGAHPRRKRKRYFVEIDGQEFSVDSERAALALLTEAKKLVKQSAEEAVEKVDPKVKIAAGIPVPKIETNVKTPTMKAAVAEVKATYRDAFKDALKERLRKESEEDDEQAILLLL